MTNKRSPEHPACCGLFAPKERLPGHIALLKTTGRSLLFHSLSLVNVLQTGRLASHDLIHAKGGAPKEKGVDLDYKWDNELSQVCMIMNPSGS